MGVVVGYGTFVGRVGALAVALGVGGVLGNPLGVAWADTDTGSDSSSAASDSAGEPGGVSEGESTPAGDPGPVDTGATVGGAAGAGAGGSGDDEEPDDPLDAIPADALAELDEPAELDELDETTNSGEVETTEETPPVEDPDDPEPVDEVPPVREAPTGEGGAAAETVSSAGGSDGGAAALPGPLGPHVVVVVPAGVWDALVGGPAEAGSPVEADPATGAVSVVSTYDPAALPDAPPPGTVITIPDEAAAADTETELGFALRGLLQALGFSVGAAYGDGPVDGTPMLALLWAALRRNETRSSSTDQSVASGPVSAPELVLGGNAAVAAASGGGDSGADAAAGVSGTITLVGNPSVAGSFQPIRDLVRALLGLLGYNPAIDAPGTGNPVADAIWGMVRQIERIFNNDTPIAITTSAAPADPQITLGDDGTYTVTGKLNVVFVDINGDPLTYQATTSHGTVESFDPHTGDIVISGIEAGQIVNVTVVVSDTGAHVHGIAGLLLSHGTASATYRIRIEADGEVEPGEWVQIPGGPGLIEPPDGFALQGGPVLNPTTGQTLVLAVEESDEWTTAKTKLLIGAPGADVIELDLAGYGSGQIYVDEKTGRAYIVTVESTNTVRDDGLVDMTGTVHIYIVDAAGEVGELAVEGLHAAVTQPWLKPLAVDEAARIAYLTTTKMVAEPVYSEFIMVEGSGQVLVIDLDDPLADPEIIFTTEDYVPISVESKGDAFYLVGFDYGTLGTHITPIHGRTVDAAKAVWFESLPAAIFGDPEVPESIDGRPVFVLIDAVTARLQVALVDFDNPDESLSIPISYRPIVNGDRVYLFNGAMSPYGSTTVTIVGPEGIATGEIDGFIVPVSADIGPYAFAAPHIAFADGSAYLLVWSATGVYLTIVDEADPNNIRSIEVPAADLPSEFGISVVDGYALLADPDGYAFVVVDTRTAAVTVFTSAQELIWSWGVDSENGRLYVFGQWFDEVADEWTLSVEVVDLTDPDAEPVTVPLPFNWLFDVAWPHGSPTVLAELYDEQTETYRLALIGMDGAVLGAPTVIAESPEEFWAAFIALGPDGRTVYVVDDVYSVDDNRDTVRLHILDTAAGTATVVDLSEWFNWGAWDLAVAGDHVYVAGLVRGDDGSECLRAVVVLPNGEVIASPAEPVPDDFEDLPLLEVDPATGVGVLGSWKFVPGGGSSVAG